MLHEVESNTEFPAVSIMKAASIANLHLSTVYKLRSKLNAFQREGMWYVPLSSLEAYMQERVKRARQIIAASPNRITSDQSV